jgi:hypothetical protein
MDMQDKEFDNLFRAKLDNFEAGPTSQVWDGIVEGLDGKRRYKALLPWLSIAASILVLAVAGILFIPQKTSVGTKPPVKPGIAKIQPPASVIKADPLKVAQQNSIQPAHTVNMIARIKPVHSTAVNTRPVTTEPKNPVKPVQQEVLAAIQRKQEVINPVVPDNSTLLATKPVIDDAPAFITKPTLTASTLPANNWQIDAPATKSKRKAHGIAGLLNAVIATVDKRKDKLIEFTDSDDDETNVMSINLGALKSKRERDK